MQVPPDLAPPVKFSSFITVVELQQAAAASGTVFRMRAPQSGADCVFKLITLPLRTEQEITQALNAIKSVWGGAGSHPNIVSLFDVEYDRPTSRFVFAIEWMDAQSLARHLGVPYPEQVVGGIISQTLNALAYLHKQTHTCHRDLKPSNILLNTAGHAKITDLGQGRQLENTMDNINTYVGSQVYMSPERIEGASYMSNCDIWSLGIITLECAMGKYPYIPEGETDIHINEVIDLIEENDPPRLEVAGYSEAARDFCDKCVEKVKERRMTSVDLLPHPWIVSNAAPQCHNAVAAWVQARVCN